MPAGFIHKYTHTKKKSFHAYMSSHYVKNMHVCGFSYSRKMTAYLSEGQFPQEVGTAGPAPLSSDDLTEKKTDWINIIIVWPCEVDTGFQFIITRWKL